MTKKVDCLCTFLNWIKGVDFVGGRTFQVRFETLMDTEVVKAELTKVLVLKYLKYLEMIISKDYHKI
jgi:hypothetical protein